jgi:hypothetical protein
VLLWLLLLTVANLTIVQCSKGNSTAAKHKRCSACQIFVHELHNQMAKSADTKDTILKQAMLTSNAALCPKVLHSSQRLTFNSQDAMGYKLRVPYAGSTVQVNDILEKVRPLACK